MALHVTDATFESEVLNENGVVLVDFWAEWCGPCKMLLPIIDEVSEEMQGKAKVVKVDVDSNAETAMKLNIRSIPTLVFYKNGEIIATMMGVQEKETIIEKLNSLI